MENLILENKLRPYQYNTVQHTYVIMHGHELGGLLIINVKMFS